MVDKKITDLPTNPSPDGTELFAGESALIGTASVSIDQVATLVQNKISANANDLIGTFVFGTPANLDGWLECDGSEFDKSDYPELSALWDNLYSQDAWYQATSPAKFRVPNFNQYGLGVRAPSASLNHLDGEILRDAFQGHAFWASDSDPVGTNGVDIRNNSPYRGVLKSFYIPAGNPGSFVDYLLAGNPDPNAPATTGLIKTLTNDGANGTPRVAGETRGSSFVCKAYVRAKKSILLGSTSGGTNPPTPPPPADTQPYIDELVANKSVELPPGTTYIEMRSLVVAGVEIGAKITLSDNTEMIPNSQYTNNVAAGAKIIAGGVTVNFFNGSDPTGNQSHIRWLTIALAPEFFGSSDDIFTISSDYVNTTPPPSGRPAFAPASQVQSQATQAWVGGVTQGLYIKKIELFINCKTTPIKPAEITFKSLQINSTPLPPPITPPQNPTTGVGIWTGNATSDISANTYNCIFLDKFAKNSDESFQNDPDPASTNIIEFVNGGFDPNQKNGTALGENGYFKYNGPRNRGLKLMAKIKLSAPTRHLAVGTIEVGRGISLDDWNSDILREGGLQIGEGMRNISPASINSWIAGDPLNRRLNLLGLIDVQIADTSFDFEAAFGYTNFGQVNILDAIIPVFFADGNADVTVTAIHIINY